MSENQPRDSQTTDKAMVIAKVYVGTFFQMTWDEASEDLRREALEAGKHAVRLLEDQPHAD